MERDLAQSGAIVLKFWMQIDKDEQERRFMERQNNPKNSGRLQMKTGEIEKNGKNMKRQWMKCLYAHQRNMLLGLL